LPTTEPQHTAAALPVEHSSLIQQQVMDMPPIGPQKLSRFKKRSTTASASSEAVTHSSVADF
jgi:hypothetical protein